MLEDSGKKIQTYAKIVLGVGVLIGIASAIVGVLTDGAIGFLIGLLVGALIFLAYYVLALFLRAFGDLVESNNRQTKLLASILDAIFPRSAASHLSAPRPSEPTPRPESAGTISDGGKVTHFPTRPPHTLVCPSCGMVQKSDRATCWKCATTFVFDDEV